MTILAIHGGAGGDGEWRGLTPLDPERVQCMKRVLESIGPSLESGTLSALEAVTQAVELMEDEPLFNAGIGSVLDEDGTVTMDASIMNGKDGAAGSVVNVRRIRHPIRAANAILKQGWPVMLNSEAADKFAIILFGRRHHRSYVFRFDVLHFVVVTAPARITLIVIVVIIISFESVI